MPNELCKYSLPPQLSAEEISNFVDNNVPKCLKEAEHGAGGGNVIVESGNAPLEPLLLGYVADKPCLSLEPSRQLTVIDGKYSLACSNVHFSYPDWIMIFFCPLDNRHWHYSCMHFWIKEYFVLTTKCLSGELRKGTQEI